MPGDPSKLFVPNMDEKPHVTHPHMNKKFVNTFLHVPHIKRSPSNYMLPDIEHHKNNITVKKDEVFYADLDMYSAKSYTKVVVRDLCNSSKIGIFCAEYIFFHRSNMKMIPYNTEIIYFLKH